MKKSILALGALAVVGGLGLAGSAQAVVALGVDGVTAGTNATGLQLNVGSTGHELIVPYYSVQGQNVTMFTIVNTDSVNGKAVKVRFRGAANTDDVLDFTVLMSPNDVWTAGLTQGSDGLAHLSSSDKTCTIPQNSAFSDVPFITTRFPAYMSADNQAANTREGYIEILNMANIPPNIDGTPLATPTTTPTNPLYIATKHVAGVPPCTTGPIVALLDKVPMSGASLTSTYGLDNPTGGLQGGWMIANQGNMAQFSGNDTAVQAVVSPAVYPGVNATANVMFSPQIADVYNDITVTTPTIPPTSAQYTADPLLTGANGTLPAVSTLYYDMPDLSTPMAFSIATAPLNTPTGQAFTLAAALGRSSIDNEFINDPQGVVPLSTDWVLSQATRRYFATVNYADTAAHAAIVYNDTHTSNGGTAFTPALPYAATGTGAGNLSLQQTAFGPQACLIGSSDYLHNREEGPDAGAPPVNNPLASFSPSTPPTAQQPNPGPMFCGEVATLTWGVSPLSATLTNTTVTTPYTEGWGVFNLNPGSGALIPVTGYAAELGTNAQTGFSLGVTFPHRWW
jgi:hypothetical protein